MNNSNNIERSKKIAEHLTSVMQNKEYKQSEEFERWINENTSAADILADLSNEDKLTYECNNFSVNDKKLGAQKMLNKIAARQRKRIAVKLSSIAAVLISLSFVMWYSIDYINQENEEVFAVMDKSNNVKLVLENGDIVELNNDIDSIKTNNMLLHNAGGHEIAVVDNNANDETHILISKLVVPNKKKYSIVLCDGTKVMLNANSELSFPNRFKEDTREVTIKGEGYFEVTKDEKRPFIVHSEGTSIKVYGTKFNVNNYDLQQIETILLEGSIGITINNKEQMLKPNQLITINNNNGHSKIDNIVDTNKYTAWTNGYFVFQADNLAKVINELSRWYNVEFVVGSNSRLDIPITGSFSRSTELEEIISSLEMISGIKLITKK